MERRSSGDDTGTDSRGDVARAYAPYLIIIAVFSIAQIGPIKDALAGPTQAFDWPGLDVRNPDGDPLSSVTYNFNWLPATGTLMLISGLLTMAALRIKPRARCAPTARRSTSSSGRSSPWRPCWRWRT